MKKLLITLVLMTAILSHATPLSAQILRNSGKTVQGIKNPVRYQNADAFSEGRGVWIEWKTEAESNNLGFYVYRLANGERQIVSALIPGAFLQARENKITAGSYSFFDRAGDTNSIYLIESYNLNGERHYSNRVQTQFISDLSKVAGTTSEQLNAQSRNSNPEVLGNESLLPADLAAEVAENRPAANPQTQQWVAAQPGVKIGVKREGFYRVTRAELEMNGFDVNSPAANWQLYVNGIEQAINVSESGAYIEFYGKGIDTLESDTQSYFLLVGANRGKRIGTSFRRRVNSGVISESYAQSHIKKEREFYAPQILNGDGSNIVGAVITSGGDTVPFDLSGVDFNSQTASIDLTLQGLTTIAHQVRVAVNDVQIGTLTGSGYVSISKHFDFPTSVLREGANVLQLQSLIASGDVTAFDAVKVNFARRYQAEQNWVSFHVPNYKATYVDGFTSENIRVFDTTNPDSPVFISGLNVESNNGNYRVYLPSNRARVMVAVEDTGLLPAASIKPNNPSNLASLDNEGTLIIISHKDFMTQAEDWANYRRAQGMAVQVVDVEDVYDEFNYGVLSPDSIRDFLFYAKNNWKTRPNYAFLIGDATNDPRNYFPTTAGNFVPTRMFDSIYSETNSDETLGDFNNDGLAEIAIGRIPVRTPEVATMLLGKVTAFEQNVGGAISRGAVFAYDLPDGYDFEGLSGRLRDQLPTNILRVMIGRGMPNANALLMSELNSGKFLVNYSGHGSSTVWAAGAFFGNANAAQLTNGGDKLSIFTMLTCLNGYFLNSTDSLSEVLLKNPNGGAVTTWASSGLTTPDVQEIMATRFYNQVAFGNIQRIGDLIKDAKTTINFGRDVRLSWVLLGDPTTRVR